jgi:hypothetical protein
VSTRQLAALGYGRNSASKAHKVGRLRRIHRGVYAVGHASLDWDGRCMGAVLAARPAVASHLSAAYLWGLLRYRPERMHVSVASSRRRRRAIELHFANLDPADRSVVEGIPVTSSSRTLLDLAALKDEARLADAVERADQARLFDLAEIDRVLGRYRGHLGGPALRQAIAGYRDDPTVTRSSLERRFLELIKSAELPLPSMNFNVAGLEVDAYWRSDRLAVVIDAFSTHGSRASFERDRARDQALRLEGVDVIRVTALQLHQAPDQVIATLESLLRRRASGAR